MASHPSDIVTRFFACWNTDHAGMLRSLGDFLAPDAIWENVGVARTVGPAEAIAFMTSFDDLFPVDHIEVEMIAMAEAGNLVLHERVDHLKARDGRLIASARIASAIEVRDGMIVAWRDYFDTAPLVAARAASPVAVASGRLSTIAL